MASVFDVAQYLLGKLKADGALPVTTWKLQKLVFYSQAWSSVWDDAPLFEDRIEAWANGPVCPALYKEHRGRFKIDSIGNGSVGALSKDQIETINEVYSFYGSKTPQYLSELTHSERPWIEAREGLNPGERGSSEITLESMSEYYGSLHPDGARIKA